MRRPRGFALVGVLAALLIMAMMVAVGAQRALVAVRESALALARVEMSAAAVGAMAAVLAAPVDTAGTAVGVPGATIDSGTSTCGRSRASWRLTAATAHFATMEIDARAPVINGATREFRRLIVGLRADSAGALWWVPVGGGGRGRIPAP